MSKWIPVEERLRKHSKRAENGCLEWTGALKNGYGYLTVGSRKDGTRRTIRAHRAAYREWNGPIGDAWVLHTCDNRRCIEPTHLYLGDRQQNTKDAIERDRLMANQGENNPNAKISEVTARCIKWLRSRGIKCQDIADGFGVSLGVVKDISSGRGWSHIPDPPGE